MNVTELARQLRVRTDILLDILPEFGFDIGKKAIKIDDRVAQQIKRQWNYIKRELQKRETAEAEKKRQLEREARREQGITITIPSRLRVIDLATQLNLPVTRILAELMKSGVLVSQNENIDFDTAAIIATELGFTVHKKENENNAADAPQENLSELAAKLEQDKLSGNLVTRPPVVVVMGHVDHGKTKLLDTIRSANVAAGEAGGITQHIGAYQVEWKVKEKGAPRKLTFIDTPGHEAFTVMRSRGAKVADIAILVVAADDGVKPQTVEVISILKAAKLPFVVAVNKIDKPDANAQKVIQELSTHGVLVEAWGGTVPLVEISAKNNLNIDKLLDVLLLVADLDPEKFKASADRAALGTVVESHIDKGQGPVATILVHAGTLKRGDALVLNGELYGKVRAMKDFTGDDVAQAGPSMPVKILGFKVAPVVGDILDVGAAQGAKKMNLKSKFAEQRAAQRHTTTFSADVAEEDRGAHLFPVFVKADTLGSLEAILASLAKMHNDEVAVKVIGKGLGNITDADARQAQAADAHMFGFNVTGQPAVLEFMRDKGVPFFEYDIIYDLLNFVKEKLEGMMNPEVTVNELGELEVLATFKGDKKGKVVGGKVKSGKAVLGEKVRLVRGGDVLGSGDVVQLQMNKADVKEVPSGSECGLKVALRESPEKGDILQFYHEEVHKRTIDFKDN